MAYEVTATRRRPQRFEDLVGQEFVAATLKNSIQSGKIAHAYLFSGPRGCGKTSSARILAKALNCQSSDKPVATPCCNCPACTEITKGSSMDVIEIDGASNTSVNDVRQIKDEVQFPPQSSRYKIYIIDEVHMLSTSAFNALLKTIEEPPPYVVFIFATTELQKVPATIKSRCQQFNFRLVPVEQVKNLLSEACQEIGIQADDEALYWIARESTGSIRDAYTLFDQVAAFSDGHITYEKIRDKLGLVGVDRLNELFEKCCDNAVENVITTLDEYLQSGVSIEQLISNSADYLRSLLLLKNGIKKEALLGQAPERYSQKVLEAWNSVQLERALSLFLQLYRDIRYSLSPRFEIELTFSRLCWLNQYVSPSEVKKAIDNAKNLLLQGESASEAGSGKTGSTVAFTQNAVNKATETSPGSSSSQAYAGGAAGAPQFTGMQHSGRPTFSALSNANALNSANTASLQKAPALTNEPNFSEQDGDYPHVEEEPDIPPPDLPDEGYNSFSYGGALPPEKSAASTNTTGKQPDTASNSTNTVSNLSADDIKRKLIEALTKKDDGFTASAVMQAKSWNYKENAITVTVDSGFKKSQLERQKNSICEILSNICGNPIQFTVEIQTEQKIEQASVEIPEEVTMICDMFRGTIIGGKK